MAKSVTRYVCQSCGHETPRWVGRCPECNEWNTLVEEVRVQQPSKSLARGASVLPAGSGQATPISQIRPSALKRASTGVSELNRVLGGGMVPGSVVLVGGEPGIGKSTLMTQAAWAVANASGDSTALYVSGEESGEQIRLRAERLGSLSDNLLILNETNVHAILHQIESIAPAVVIVDSIQTTYDPGLDSAPGNVSQLRECAAALTRLAKQRGIPLFLIGHVTKEGSIAGPRILEHMVDAVLYFEGDRHHAYRILRAVKNRFGSTDEIGIFEMRESGLCEVENPSGALLAERSLHSTGSAVAATLEGSRALLVEVQALVSRSFLASPRRTANGIDVNRVHMLLAGMEKRAGLRLGEQDVFLNVVGGVRVVEPATDLAVTMAVASSFRDQAVDPEAVLIGEVGLGGEIRAVSQLEKRLKEASRLGFKRALIPKYGAPKSVAGIKLCPVSTLQEAIGQCLKPA